MVERNKETEEALVRVLTTPKLFAGFLKRKGIAQTQANEVREQLLKMLRRMNPEAAVAIMLNEAPDARPEGTQPILSASSEPTTSDPTPALQAPKPHDEKPPMGAAEAAALQWKEISKRKPLQKQEPERKSIMDRVWGWFGT